MSIFYKKSFIFHADRYEEWDDEKCISKGSINTEIIAEVIGNNIRFQFDDIGDIKMSIPCIFDIKGKDYCVLPDRIEYKNRAFDGKSSIEPYLCSIFYKKDKIEFLRFAMTYPDRLVEFYGHVSEVGQTGSIGMKPTKEQIRQLINEISKIQKRFSEIADMFDDLHAGIRINNMYETFKFPLYLAWRGYKYGWHTDFMEEDEDMFPLIKFEVNVVKYTQELIDTLETDSPFAGIEINSSMTNSLIRVYKRFIYDIKNGIIKIYL